MGFISSITAAEIGVCESAPSFLQSSMWAEFKSRFGWVSRAFIVNWESYGSFPLLTLSRRFMRGPGFSFTYIPWGPVLPPELPAENGGQVLEELAQKLKPLLGSACVFIRFDPPWLIEKSEDALLQGQSLKRAAATVQAPDTVLVNLSNSCEQLLSQMKPKWRYNIQLSAKKGVQVKCGGETELETFYALLKETSVRDGIAVHSFDYYKTLYKICTECEKDGKNIQIRLYTAVHENETIASIMVLFYGECASYLYGASSNIKRNLMSPYALQWKAMQDAKEAGCLYYDLFGIPPNDDPNHPMAGLYRFKTGFGGQIVHRLPSCDYPYKKTLYVLFNLAESLRKKLRDLKKKK